MKKPNVIEYPDIDKPEEYMRVRKEEWDRMIKRVAELELLVKEYNRVFQYAGWDSWKSKGDK
jgi:hypothetical protein